MATVVAVATNADTSATSTTAVRTKRLVRVRGTRRTASSGRRLEHITGAAHGVDHRRAAGVDLAPEVGDVELDDVGLAAEVVVPDPVQDLRLAEHPPGVAHEEAQQLVLGRGQPDLLARAAHLVGVLVQC